MREFATGATRDGDAGKFDYEGFLSPLALERFAAYMHRHRLQADGNLRDSDNWQKGIPLDAYMKSAWRHFFDWWKAHRGLNPSSAPGRVQDFTPGEELEESICALIFNAMGYLHETLKNGAERKAGATGCGGACSCPTEEPVRAAGGILEKWNPGHRPHPHVRAGARVVGE